MPVLSLLGALLLLGVLVDVALTTLAPVAHGRVDRMTSAVLRALSRPLPDKLSGALGPLTVALMLLTWLLGLWIGFALVYLPYIESFAFSADVRFADKGLVEALYVSGVQLTTLGLGDVPPETDVLRMLTILQAASGLGLFTAAISYLPAIYTLVTELRTSARVFTDLGIEDPATAAELVVHGGVSPLSEVLRDLAQARQHLQRFPLLLDFRAPRDESMLALLRGGTVLALVLRWGVDHDRVPHAALWGQAIDTATTHLLAEVERLVSGKPSEDEDGGEVDARIARVREGVATVDPEAVSTVQTRSPAVRLLGRADRTIAAFAHHRGDPPEPLLASADR